MPLFLLDGNFPNETDGGEKKEWGERERKKTPGSLESKEKAWGDTHTEIKTTEKIKSECVGGRM